MGRSVGNLLLFINLLVPYNPLCLNMNDDKSGVRGTYVTV